MWWEDGFLVPLDLTGNFCFNEAEFLEQVRQETARARGYGYFEKLLQIALMKLEESKCHMDCQLRGVARKPHVRGAW